MYQIDWWTTGWCLSSFLLGLVVGISGTKTQMIDLYRKHTDVVSSQLEQLLTTITLTREIVQSLLSMFIEQTQTKKSKKKEQ